MAVPADLTFQIIYRRNLPQFPNPGI